MVREILQRVLPKDMVVHFHEGHKASLNAASRNTQCDSTQQTGTPENELQQLLEFFDRIIYQHLDDRAKTRTKQREPRSELVTAQRLGSVPDAIKSTL
ncbi:hypothetical protein HPB50_018440 [Hyalomma asiaticum]|uniref:Uncharacterized protein n=1 Tax=Hyalomma asiaticum TaxID=266040 RepID=A0ACB7S138_HYAAI|nr:hypothetical protein HPB50_018440 [Hyalomma asiaticum]